MKTRHLLLLPFLLAACLVQAAAVAPDYAIKLSRLSTVGERYHLVASGADEQSLNASIDGQPMPARNETLAVELVADCEVLALTPTGREAKTQLVITKLVRLTAGDPVELLPAGTIVIAERIGTKTNFTMGDSPVAPAVAKALATTGITMNSDDSASDDDVFGTTERKQVGATWPINAAPAAADLTKQHIPAVASNLSGTVTLVEVIQQEKQPVLRIAATLVMRGVNPPMPPGLTVDSSEMTTSHSGLFPADPSQRIRQQSSNLNMAITASGTQNGKTMAMSMTKKSSYEQKITSN